MNKIVLLFTLPIMLFSCSKGVASNQRKVSYAEMIINVMKFEQMRKAKNVTATYTITETTDNWDIIGYSDDTFQTGYQIKNYSYSWTVYYTLDNYGNLVGEYDPDAAVVEPYYVDVSIVDHRFERVAESEGTEQIEFFMNPYRMKLYGSWLNALKTTDVPVFLSLYYCFDETFNDEQWIQSYSRHEYYYIYNNDTGVQAWRDTVLTCKFAYTSYY